MENLLNKNIKLDKWDLETLENLGLDVNTLTEDQINTILIPCHAPENYMCDGEISARDAETRWMKQLVASGLNVKDVAKAIKLVK